LNSQTNKESSGVVKAAIIGGIIAGVFTVVAACVGGGFLILNTLVAQEKFVVTPTSAPVSQVNPVTEVPAIAPPLSPTFVGQCASMPVNPKDNVEVQLDPSRWYTVEESDNQSNPPVHIFRTQIGNVSVKANAIGGVRAWECRGESEAFLQSQTSAINYKHENPSIKVIGPDGQEVK
jgi:hypothetical protein